MDYLVELKVDYKDSGERLFVRVIADSAEAAVEKAESAWGYDALSVGETPKKPLREHSGMGKYRFPVEKKIATRVGEKRL